MIEEKNNKITLSKKFCKQSNTTTAPTPYNGHNGPFKKPRLTNLPFLVVA